jgi:3-phosphoshikimate 1-carboxyvinyltransferase
MAEGLQALGVDARATDDGMIIQGGTIQSGTVHSHDDHRIAMAFSMAALCATGKIEIEDCDNVSTSFPNFVELALKAGLSIELKG